MITIWAGLIAGCLAAISCPCQICERGRLPQTHVFIEVTVSRMGGSRRWSRLLGSSWTHEQILISAICTVFFSVAFPVDVDAQVICFAVKFVAGTFCRACWNWGVASLKRRYLFKGLVQTYIFFTSKRSSSFHDFAFLHSTVSSVPKYSIYPTIQKISHFFSKVKSHDVINLNIEKEND